MFSLHVVAACAAVVASPGECSSQAVDSANIALNRYVAAVGGAARLANVQTRITKYVLSFGRGISGAKETVQRAPDLIVEHGTARAWIGWNGTFGRGFDGSIAWTLGPEDPFRALDPDSAARYVLETRLDRLTKLDSLFPTRRWLGHQTIAGRDVDVIELQSIAGTRETWFLSADSALLVRTVVAEIRAAPAPAHHVVTTMFEDYRAVDGLLFPFRTTVDDGARRIVASAQSISINVPVPHSAFTPPAP